MNFKQFIEGPLSDFWNMRMKQFQRAQGGEKGAITDPRQPVATYKPTKTAQGAQPQLKPEFDKDSFGVEWERRRPADADDLTTLNRWQNPASDGSYYYKDKKLTNRWLIMRPNVASLTRP